MKRFRLIGLTLVAVALAASALLMWFQRRVGDIRPAIFPPKAVPRDSGLNAMGLTLPDELRLTIFTQNLGAPRDLEFTAGGTLLVSVPSGGKVVALPDRNNDGSADETKEIITGLNKPHGLAFHKGKLFVAEETRVSRWNWNEETMTASLEKALLSLPYNGGHNTRTLVFNANEQLFVSLGSSCNVCVERHPWLAAVIVTDAEGANPRVYSTGLRNAVFLAHLPETNQIWATEMGRDHLGDNLPPEEINILKEGANYGWPYCYSRRTPDTSFGGTPARCSSTELPAFEMPAHNAPLGLTFINSNQFPEDWQGDLLVALHGSWNRSVPDGYKVIRIDRDGTSLTGSQDFITGFIVGSQAAGRPVDLIFDKNGTLFLSDDKAGQIYLIRKR